jgi:hypothetical protein
MRLADHEDPWVCDTLAWWNEYVVYLFHTGGTDCPCRRVFGNKQGKVSFNDPDDEGLGRGQWQEFVQRRDERKAAALKAAETRIQAMAGT